MGAKYTEAQKRATMKYLSEKTEEIKLRLPKGKREEIKAKASALGYTSLSSFLLAAIEAFDVPANEKKG